MILGRIISANRLAMFTLLLVFLCLKNGCSDNIEEESPPPVDAAIISTDTMPPLSI